ncbi:MAG: glycosyltransferase family 4 protein [Bacteroidales bacterium]|nr:glycosyltransferase family 4 protein [Bacteroidales bacterium]
MRIAYFTAYLGKEFTEKYGKGRKFALSGSLKSQGLARAMMAAGHEVTMYSPGVTTCDARIGAFTEKETYPEGTLTIKYCDILSKRRCDPINQLRMARYLKREQRQKKYDVIVYYNITLGAALMMPKMKGCKQVLEYEDNIFNKSLAGDRNSFEGFKRWMYKRIVSHTDGLFSVCNGLMLPEIQHKVLTPGVINEEVLSAVTFSRHSLTKGKPVTIILTGGIHYSKGGDLLVKAIRHLKTPCQIRVFGNCNLSDELKKLVEDTPKQHSFVFEGYCPHKELIGILNQDADILINTTRSMGVGAQAAGFPFKMMEYASTGRPIVSSEIGKLNDEFNSHITYYEEESPEAIAKAIESVISDYEKKVSLAQELQKKVISQYSIEGLSQTVSTLLNSLVNCK